MLHNCFKRILTNLSMPCLLISSWAAVAMPMASFEAVVIEIPNTTLIAGSTVPAGTPLKLVTLTTTHIIPEPQTVSRFGVTLTFPKIRFGLRTGSAVTYSIDGETIATEVPVQRTIRLETNVGLITGVGFSIGENSYLLTPTRTSVEGVTSTIADSTAMIRSVAGIANLTYGFFPANAEPISGQLYLERYRGSELNSNQITPVVLYDADGLRGTSASPAEEIIITDRQDNSPFSLYIAENAEEVEVEVVFNDGRQLQLLAIRFVRGSSLAARTVVVYFFDTEALIANGRSIEDIAQVRFTTPVNHDLHWEQLGFSNVQQNNNLNTSINENRPPVANNDSYVVDVSSRLNVEANNGVLANDSDTAGDILTARLMSQTSNGILVFLNDGSFSYTPNLRFTGEDSFTYAAFDGEVSSTATVTIDVQQTEALLEKAKVSQINLSQAKNSLFLIVEQKKLAHDVFITLSEYWQKRHLKLLVRVESLHLRAIKRRLKNNDLNSILNNSTGVFNSSKLQKLYWELVNRGQNSVLDAFHVSAFLKEMDIVNLQSVIDASKNGRITEFSQTLMNNSKKHLRFLIKQIERKGGIYKPQEMNQNELNTMPNEGNVSPNQNDAQPIARDFTNDEIIRLNAIVRRSLNVINEFDSIRGRENSISRIRELSEQARNALSDYVIAQEEIRTAARNNNEIFNTRARSVFAGQLDFVEDINRELLAELNKMS